MQFHQVEKLEIEAPIPECWRGQLTEIVSCLVKQDYALSKNVHGVRPVDEEVLEQIRDYIGSYGEQLIPLPENTWDTSMYIWQESYWNILVDLWTENEGCSDLVLQLKAFEVLNGYEFEVYMVYVP